MSSASGIHRIVTRELVAAAAGRGLLSDEAFAIHQERTEALFAAHWPTALDPASHRSALVSQRILPQQTRFYGLIEVSGPLPAPTATGPAADDDNDEPQDELARLRAERHHFGAKYENCTHDSQLVLPPSSSASSPSKKS